MAELSDEMLHELFRSAGPHAAPSGLHEAVMHRVLQTTLDPLPAERRLISLRAWAIIGLMVAMLLVLAAMAPFGPDHAATALPTIPALSNFLDHFGKLDVSYLYWAVPITASLFALTLLDRILAHGRFRPAH